MEKKVNVPVILWEAIYPVLLYYALMLAIRQIMFYVFNWLDKDGHMGIAANYPLTSTICAIIILPFIFSIYCNDRNPKSKMLQYMAEHKPNITIKKVLTACAFAVVMIVIGNSLANIITMLPFTSNSQGYSEASAALYSGTLLTQILNSVVFVPLLEELVYRGVVLYRMKKRVNLVLAIGIQALLFGLLHGNIVQALFGFIIGIFFGLIAEQADSIFPAVLSHMVYNLFALLRTNFGWMRTSIDRTVKSWILSGLFLFIGIVVFIALYKFVHKAVDPD